MKTLKDVKVGETATVVKLHGEGATKRRIMDMGITKGVEVHVRKVAPLGDPMELNVRGYELSVRKSDAEMIDQPIVVLMDDQSISAAEFFAAALQEYDRATLVGTHTTGKGRAQQTFELSDGSALNLSVEEYFTPQGNNLAGVGIAPDVEVALTDAQSANFYFLSPEEDPQLQKAVEILG